MSWTRVAPPAATAIVSPVSTAWQVLAVFTSCARIYKAGMMVPAVSLRGPGQEPAKDAPAAAEPATEEQPSVITRVLLCKVVGGREQSRKAVSGPSTWEESRGVSRRRERARDSDSRQGCGQRAAGRTGQGNEMEMAPRSFSHAWPTPAPERLDVHSPAHSPPDPKGTGVHRAFPAQVSNTERSLQSPRRARPPSVGLTPQPGLSPRSPGPLMGPQETPAPGHEERLICPLGSACKAPGMGSVPASVQNK